MNHTFNTDELAALSALGILADDERALAAGNAAVAEHEIAYREALVSLAESLDPVAPPAEMKRKVLDAVRSRTVRANEGHWCEFAPGVRMKKLHSDRARNTVTVLMEMTPGAIVPPHDHRHPEDSFVIRGSCRIGSASLNTGDFHHMEADSHHDAIVSDEGCAILLVMDYHDYKAA